MQIHDALAEALFRESDPAYLIDPSGRIVFLNDAWNRAARAHLAPNELSAEAMLGRPWLSGIHGTFRRYYAAVLGRAFRQVWMDDPIALVHLSEHNTETRARTQATRLIPLHREDHVNGAAFVLIVHTLVADAELSARHPLHAFSAARHLRAPEGTAANGGAIACGCCRRVLASDGNWELVPEFLRPSAPAWVDAWRICPECRMSWYGLPTVEVMRRRKIAKLPVSAGLWLRATGIAPGAATGS